MMRYVDVLETILRDELRRADYDIFLALSTPDNLFITKSGKYYKGPQNSIINSISETICLKVQHMYWRTLDHCEITHSPPEHDSLLMIRIFLESMLNLQEVVSTIVQTWFSKLTPPPRTRHSSNLL
jgi:hypothetical protein